MRAGREEDATTASKSRSICPFPSKWSVLGLKHISPATTKSTRQSTWCQVPVTVKKRHKPLGDLNAFIFRIRLGRLGGGGPRSFSLFGFGFLPGSSSSSARPAATGGGCSVVNVFLSRFFGTSGSRNLARSTVPFAGAIALGSTFALAICVPVPTGDATLPFPLSLNRLTVPPSWTPFGTAALKSGRHSGRQGHPARSRRPRSIGCAWAARAFDLHSAGRERDGDLSVREGRHCPRSVGGIEYRR